MEVPADYGEERVFRVRNDNGLPVFHLFFTSYRAIIPKLENLLRFWIINQAGMPSHTFKLKKENLSSFFYGNRKTLKEKQLFAIRLSMRQKSGVAAFQTSLQVFFDPI